MLSKSFHFIVVLAFLIGSTNARAHDFRKLVQKTDPSVVLLYTEERGVNPQVGPQGQISEVNSAGLGSGVVIDDKGHILTAAHVVQTADSVEAHFVDGTKVRATVIGSNPNMDVALLALNELPEGIKPAKLGDSDDVRVGDQIFVIGAPLGLSHSFSVGHISRRHDGRTDNTSSVRAEVFQTDAAINQGNSGGPMFNRKGEVVGVVSYIRTRSGGSEGLGFAVTINDVVKTLFEERAFWSGMSGVALSPGLATALNVPAKTGFLVQKVAANSPADLAGLRASRVPATIAGRNLLIGGDVILSIAGIAVSPDMMSEVDEKHDEMHEEMPADGSVQLRVFRYGEILDVVIPISATPLRDLATKGKKGRKKSRSRG